MTYVTHEIPDKTANWAVSMTCRFADSLEWKVLHAKAYAEEKHQASIPLDPVIASNAYRELCQWSWQECFATTQLLRWQMPQNEYACRERKTGRKLLYRIAI